MSKTKKQLKANLKFRVFLVFLCLSMLFWTLIKLSKTYTSDIVFSVEYINIPANKVIQNKPVDLINASVKSTGFNLFRYKLKQRKLIFDVSNLTYKNGSKYFYLPNKHLSKLNKQLNVETKIDRIIQDTIFLDFGFNETKKIPIELDANIQYKLGYNTTSKLLITPDSITIIGPKDILDTIFIAKTEKIELLNISSEINHKVSLKSFKTDKITISENLISFSAPVDKFTEGILLLPFEVINLPQNYSITTFPREVEVVYKVGLSNFNKITKLNMKVECDFNETKNNNLNYLIPKLKETPSIITSVRIIPNKIEFLIEE